MIQSIYILYNSDGSEGNVDCVIATIGRTTIVNPDGASVITYSKQTVTNFGCGDDDCNNYIDDVDSIKYKEENKHFAFVGVDDLNYELKHKIYTTDMSASSDGSEGKNMVTVFKYHNGTEAHIFPVGVPIQLSIKDWVDLAGISLDDINYNVNINNENNKHNSYRFTGVNLQVTLDYDNSDDLSINFGNVTNLISSILLIYYS